MKKTLNNYQNLTAQMLEVFEDVKNNTMSIDRANTLTKISNAVVRIQVAKIISTRIAGENDIDFFKN